MGYRCQCNPGWIIYAECITICDDKFKCPINYARASVNVHPETKMNTKNWELIVSLQASKE